MSMQMAMAVAAEFGEAIPMSSMDWVAAMATEAHADNPHGHKMHGHQERNSSPSKSSLVIY